MVTKKYILIFFAYLFSFLFGFNQMDFLNKKNTTIDIANYSTDVLENDKNKKREKNQFLAMGLSAIIPGSGQIYNGDWKRGVGYLSLEIFLWMYRENYNNKAKKYENLYKQFADQHWSFENWVKNYYSFNVDDDPGPEDPVYDTMINFGNNEEDNGCDDGGNNGWNGYCNPWGQAHSIAWYDNSGYHNTTQQLYTENLFKNQCGKIDNGYPNPTLIDYYTNLDCLLFDPNYFDNVSLVRDHHFYEGIGKYNLFFAGWDDVHECINLETGILEISDDCRWSVDKNNYDVALSKNKQYYQDYLRAKTNDKYDYAENALTVIFVNHAISMLDALISNVLNKNKEGLKFHSEPIFNLNYKGGLEGIKFNLEW